MALIIEAPNEIYNVENAHNLKLFLAGGITGCPDWQREMIDQLENFPFLTIYNPRRKDFVVGDSTMTEQQITWEFIQLQNSQMISFWFSSGSINPIVLYELGMWGNSRKNKKIFVGIDPDYERRQDVITQSVLADPNFDYYESIEEMTSAIKSFIVEARR